MRSRLFALVVVGALAIAAPIAGCGGGDDDTTTSSAAGVAADNGGGGGGAGGGAGSEGNGSAGAGSSGNGEGAGGGADGDAGEGGGSEGDAGGADEAGGTGGGLGGAESPLGGGQGKSGDGGASGGDSGAGGSATKAAFIKEADGICETASAEINQKARATLREGPKGAGKEGVPAKIVNQILVPGLEAEVAEVRALSTPAGISGEVEAVLTAIQEAVDRARANPRGFIVQSNPFTKSEKLGKQFGFSACGAL